jgi:hypothetical protein
MHTTPDQQFVEILARVRGEEERLRIESHDKSLVITCGKFNGLVNRDEFFLAAKLVACDISESLERAFHAVQAERCRQLELYQDEKIPFTCDSDDIQLTSKLGVLMEEVGEVAREVNEADNSLRPDEALKRLRTELIQVAAVAVAWAESLPE